MGKRIELRLLGIGLLVILSGCVVTDAIPFLGKPDDTTTVYPKSAKIVIGGPTGFCVNSRQSRTNKDGAFITLGPCTSEEFKASRNKGLFIANVSPIDVADESINIAALASFFGSAAGLRSLSNSGDAKSVEILDTVTKHGVYFLHTRDSSEPLIPETTTENWRGFFAVSDRLVSVTMVNFIENPMPQSVVLNRLEDFAARIIQLNRATF